MPDSDLPYCVELDWWFHLPVSRDGKSLNFHGSMKTPTIRFQHRCDRGDRGVIICAPALQDAHTWDEATKTVTPSILCPDCGTHGFVRRGQWVAA